MTTTTAEEAAVRVLVAAFADDPVMRWLFPGDQAADVAFRPVVEQSAAHGELAVSDDAAAVWLPRGPEPPVGDTEELPDRLRAFLGLTEQRHPVGHEYLYLAFLAVAPDAQGRGLGGALLRERLAELGTATFAELTADCAGPHEVVARFLAVLDLYREASVDLQQPEPFGELTVHWAPASADGVDAHEGAPASPVRTEQ